MHLHNMDVHVSTGACIDRKRASDPVELDSRVGVNHSDRVLGTELVLCESSERS